MKKTAKELAEELMKHPDFEVKFSFIEPDGSNWGLTCRSFEGIDVIDIGYSDKTIVLSGEEY